ncbi:RNA polymerase sigma factor, partial [Parabacteroides merdae]
MFDISLLYKLKKGNREAFNSVFRYYYPRIMAYVASIVEQKAAEDIVQDVFLYVWENREK